MSLFLENLGQRVLYGWRGASDYSILPTGSPIIESVSWRARGQRALLTKRYARILVVGLVSISVLLFMFKVDGSVDETEEFVLLPQAVEIPGKPPLYRQYHEYEEGFPQHNPNLPFPDGKNAKFLWIANHAHSSGWGNVMQELILNAHLAYSSRRAFVFDDYTWDRYSQDYSEYGGKIIPARIPLSALLSGPIIGGSFGRSSDVPRAVSTDYFSKQCPTRTVIHTKEVTDNIGGDATAAEVLAAWIEKLNSIEDRCVEIERESEQIFNIWIFGSRRLLDIWPSLSHSPILTKLNWSPLILSAYDKNKDLFALEAPQSSFMSFLPHFPSSSLSTVSTLKKDSLKPLPGIIALHIRRGDFAQHCGHLANWSSEWNGFNTFPSLPDRFLPPPGAGWGTNTPENTDIYMRHCFPTIPQIVEKVMNIQLEMVEKAAERNGWDPEHRGPLKKVFIMTNAPREWIQELKEAFQKAGEWEDIVSSRDLELNWEQKYVAQAVDMYIGQRAQVFIGNGFSSLTSNVVMMRMSHKMPSENTRFW